MSYKQVKVLGHPFANIGRGYDARLTFKAIYRVGVDVKIYDIYKHQKPNKEQEQDILPFITDEPNSPIQIFILNGDEVIPCFNFLRDKISGNTYKIVYPQWELEKYPKEWANALELFDEIWAPSLFVQESIRKSVNKNVYY